MCAVVCPSAQHGLKSIFGFAVEARRALPCHVLLSAAVVIQQARAPAGATAMDAMPLNRKCGKAPDDEMSSISQLGLLAAVRQQRSRAVERGEPTRRSPVVEQAVHRDRTQAETDCSEHAGPVQGRAAEGLAR